MSDKNTADARYRDFCTIVDEAIRSAASDDNWALKIRIADALANFERCVRMEIATRRLLF